WKGEGVGIWRLEGGGGGWERRVSMEKGEKSIMRQYQQSERLHHCVGYLASHIAEEYVMDHHCPPVDPETTGTASRQELLQHLRGYEGGLPEAMRRPLLAAGATVVPALIPLVEDALAYDHANLCWVQLCAVDLLGAIGDARAVPVLLRCLDQEDELDLLIQQAAAALRALGALALDSCVVAYATTPRDAFRDRLAGVMS